jgi:hypothetical protein
MWQPSYAFRRRSDIPGIELRSRSFRRAVRGVVATVIAVTAATTLGEAASAADDRHVAPFEAIAQTAGAAILQPRAGGVADRGPVGLPSLGRND